MISVQNIMQIDSKDRMVSLRKNYLPCQVAIDNGEDVDVIYLDFEKV